MNLQKPGATPQYRLRFVFDRRVLSFGLTGNATLADVAQTMDERIVERYGELKRVDVIVLSGSPARSSMSWQSQQ